MLGKGGCDNILRGRHYSKDQRDKNRCFKVNKSGAVNTPKCGDFLCILYSVSSLAAGMCISLVIDTDTIQTTRGIGKRCCCYVWTFGWTQLSPCVHQRLSAYCPVALYCCLIILSHECVALSFLFGLSASLQRYTKAVTEMSSSVRRHLWPSRHSHLFLIKYSISREYRL